LRNKGDQVEFSAGIGEALAKQCAARGAKLVLVARRGAELAAVAIRSARSWSSPTSASAPTTNAFAMRPAPSTCRRGHVIAVSSMLGRIPLAPIRSNIPRR
jgi:short-subunit dehydrogenase